MAPGVSVRQLREEWARLQAAAGLRERPGLARLLGHLMEASMQRDLGRLKESVIAAEVFQRDPAVFDPQRDSIVRVSALRLRKLLASHYATDGAASEVVIELRTGSYVPHVRARTPVAMVSVPPFRDLSGDAAIASLCRALTGAFADALAAVGRLRTDDAAAAPLGPFVVDATADFALHGSIAREGAQLRVSVRIERGAQTVWSYEWVVTAAHWSQAQLAVVADTKAVLARHGVPTRGAGARPLTASDLSSPVRDLVMRSRMLLEGFGSEQAQRALELAREALRLDEQCSGAHLCAAEAIETLRVLGALHDRHASDDAIWHARAALRIDPGSGLAHARLGQLLMRLRLDWPAAAQAMQAAGRLAPDDVEVLRLRSHHLMACGRLAEALDALDAALQRDPMSLRVQGATALTLAVAGRPLDALPYLEQLTGIEPRATFAQYARIGLLLRLGRFDAHAAALAELEAREPDHPLTIAARCRALVARNKAAEAYRQLRLYADAHPGGMPDLRWAGHWASVGDAERAFDALHRAGLARDMGFHRAAVDPDFATLHAHPRWPDFLRAFAFPQAHERRRSAAAPPGRTLQRAVAAPVLRASGPDTQAEAARD